MKIGQKLVLGFAGIAILSMIAGIVSVLQNRNTQRITEIEVYRSISHLDDTSILMEAQEHMEIAAKDYLFLDVALKQRRADYFYEKERLEETYQKYYKESCVHIKPWLEEYYEAMKKYNATIEEAFELHDQGADLEVIKEKIREAAKYIEIAHEDALEPIIKHVHDYHIEPAKEAIAKGINRTTAVTIMASIITIFLVIGLGLFISRSISVPLAKLKHAAAKIGMGELDTKIEIKARDEIGDLATSFNRMTEDLKKTLVSRDYVDNIIGSMIDSLIVTTPGGKIKTANQATCELLGYKQEELIGKDVSLLFPEEVPFEGTKLGKLTKESDLENYEALYKAKDGKEIPVLFSGSVMRDNNGNITSIVCVARDITARKQTEQALQNAYKELKDTQEQLIQSSKMVAMGQLAAGISHELNQPLTCIKGFAQTALMDLSEKNPVRSDLNKIVEQADCMDDIIRSVRTFAKRSDFQLKPIDVNKPIINSLSLLNEQFRVHDIQFKRFLGKGLPAIKGDVGQLQQVFLNLLTNARDSVDSLEDLKEREVVIKSALSKDKKDIEITFKDTGIGISKETQEHIFNPFFTTKSPDKGMGLGLSIVYRIIENHKGKIDVISEHGKGAEFKVTLPVFRKERTA